MRKIHLLTLAFILMLAGTLVADEEWPQWRGPARDGSVGGSDWPRSLDSVELQWSVPLGKGYPGPIVSSQRVFVAETQGGDTEVVQALDRKTGEVEWSASWPGKGSVPFFARKNGAWIRSTPAFDGESLIVGGMNEVLVSLDAETGAENWRVDFPKRFDTAVPDFGFASSPLIDDGAVYVQAADSLIKLDVRTGETLWRSLAVDSSIFNSGAFSSPVIAEIHGTRQLLVQSRETLHGVDLEDGRVMWSQEVPHFRGMNILTPTVVGNQVLTSSYKNKTFLYELVASASGLVTREVWSYKSPAYMSSPVIHQGHAYLHLSSGRFACLNLETGEATWTTQPMGDYWSMAIQDGVILALSSEGELHLIEADPTEFRLLDTKEVSRSSTWAHLAVSGDEIFVRELEGMSVFSWGAAGSRSARRIPDPRPADRDSDR